MWQAGDHAAARAWLDADLDGVSADLLRARAMAAFDARHFALAQWLLGVHHRLGPGDAEVAERIALTYAHAGQDGEAERRLTEARALAPARASTLFNLAILRARAGRTDAAITLLREALRLDPGYAQAAGALRELTVK